MNKTYIKSKFLMKITTLRKNENDQLKVVNSGWVKMTKKNFNKSLEEGQKNGIQHNIEIVFSTPEKFQLNTIYILATGDRAWVNVLEA